MSKGQGKQRAHGSSPTKRGRPAAGKGEPSSEKTPRREGSTYGMAQASSCVAPSLKAIAGRRGVADHRLVTRWAEIVGEQLAAVCRPIRIKHSGGFALGGVLIIAAKRAQASEVEHQLETVKDRVNRFFGYRAVIEVKITQMVEWLDQSGMANAEEGAGRPAEPTRLPVLRGVSRRKLESLTEPVEDETLRDALHRLGSSVFDRADRSKSPGDQDQSAPKTLEAPN